MFGPVCFNMHVHLSKIYLTNLSVMRHSSVIDGARPHRQISAICRVKILFILEFTTLEFPSYSFILITFIFPRIWIVSNKGVSLKINSNIIIDIKTMFFSMSTVCSLVEQYSFSFFFSSEV